VAEQVALLLHLEVEHGGLAAHHQQLADAVGGAGGAMRVRAGGAGERGSGARGAGR
jgi:hypothetical protein